LTRKSTAGSRFPLTHANHKAARTLCDAMKDNAKDVCIAEAKGMEKVAKAEFDQQRKPSDGNARKVAEATVEAAYSVAKRNAMTRRAMPRPLA
jgi:hypothetical protein